MLVILLVPECPLKRLLKIVLVPLVLTCVPSAHAVDPIEDYEQARPIFWGELYANGGETLYCAVPFASGDQRRGLNIEHVFPMGWVLRPLGCATRQQCRDNRPAFNTIEADLHNLFPSRVDINKARASHAFGLIDGEQRRFGDCDFEIRGRRVEPRDTVRGDIARAMFYMHDKYDLQLFKKAAKMLLRWHKEDPPDAEEKRRNDAIEKLQGNRNPFIDTPSAVDALEF